MDKKRRDIWERALYSMDDQRLFDIARNYLGTVKTPFHKPEILARLTGFITSDEITDRVISLIDEDDARILNVVRLTSRPTMNDLVRILGSTAQGYFSLRQKVVNLQERLLLLIFDDHTIIINPILSEEIEHALLRYPQPFDAAPYSSHGESSSVPELVPTWFAAFFSLLNSIRIRSTADHHVRKSDLAKLSNAHTAEEQELTDFFNLIFEALLSDHLLKLTAGTYTLNSSRAAALFHSDSWIQVLVRLIAPLIGKKEKAALFLYDFCHILSTLRAGSERDLKIIWNILITYHNRDLSDFEQGIEILLKTGILCRDAGTIILAPYIRDLMTSDIDPESEAAVIDSDFTLTCGSYLPFKKAGMCLALGCEIQQIDTRYVFLLTKQALKRALDHGFDFSEFTECLDQLTDRSIPSNISVTMEHWKQEYDSLSIYNGVIIEASPSRARVIEKHPELIEHIIKQFSPTLFLLKSDTQHLWRDVLSRSGFDMVMEPVSAAPMQSAGLQESPLALSPAASSFTSAPVDFSKSENSSAYIDSLKKQLEQMALSPPDREDILARIDKKLIVSKQQLLYGKMDQSSVMEARGLDYQGKLHLAKQAIDGDDDLLEIHMKTREGAEQILLIRPTAVIKEGTGHLLEGRLIPSDQKFIKPLRKIFLLRKLRGSLYTPTS
jgi:hypothetical protein